MDRLEKQLNFIVEIDKLKSVFRQTLLIDESRRENDAEHSWHMAAAALVLYDYADQTQVNLARVLKMALVHDLVEIHAGDTFAFDLKANEGKQERENQAAEKLFGLLPDDQNEELRSLWREFDEMQTPDASFAGAIDRLMPFIHNYMTHGHTWRLANVTKSQVYSRVGAVKSAAPRVWDFVERVIAESVENGYILDDYPAATEK